MGQVVGAPHALKESTPTLWSSVEGSSVLVCCLPGAPAPSIAFESSHGSSAKIELKASATPESGYTSGVKQIPSPVCGLKINHYILSPGRQDCKWRRERESPWIGVGFSLWLPWILCSGFLLQPLERRWRCETVLRPYKPACSGKVGAKPERTVIVVCPLLLSQPQESTVYSRGCGPEPEIEPGMLLTGKLEKALDIELGFDGRDVRKDFLGRGHNVGKGIRE